MHSVVCMLEHREHARTLVGITCLGVRELRHLAPRYLALWQICGAATTLADTSQW